MKRILFPIAGLLSSVLFMTCQKTRPLETQQPDLIQQAKTYYTDSLSTQPLQPVNPRTSCPRTPQWTGAYTVRISTGNAVVVPIEYSRQLEIRTGFSGSKLFALDDLAHLVIYHDHAGRIQANLITAFPDTSALRSTQANFSGMILVETWNGRPVDQYRFTPNGTIYHTSGTPSTAEGKGHTTTVLSAIGMDWNPTISIYWLAQFERLQKYLLKHKKAPSPMATNPPGAWLARQKKKYLKGQLSARQIELLGAITRLPADRDSERLSRLVGRFLDYVRKGKHIDSSCPVYDDYLFVRNVIKTGHLPSQLVTTLQSAKVDLTISK